MVGISSLGSRVGVDQICRDCESEISRILLMVGSHVCVEFRDEILLRGGECETPENPNSWMKGKMIISVE